MKPTMTTAQFREDQARELSEEQFQTIVIEVAQQYGWRCAHFRGVRIQRPNGSTYYQTPVQADGAGFPDLVLLRGERAVVAELKRQNGKPTPSQEDWLRAFQLAGVTAFVWRPGDLDRIHEVLR